METRLKWFQGMCKLFIQPKTCNQTYYNNHISSTLKSDNDSRWGCHDSGPSQDNLSPNNQTTGKNFVHVLPGLNNFIALLDYTVKSYHQHKISCNDSTPQHDKDDNRNPGSSLPPSHRKSCLCKHLSVPKEKKKFIQ